MQMKYLLRYSFDAFIVVACAQNQSLQNMNMIWLRLIESRNLMTTYSSAHEHSFFHIFASY